MSAPQVGQITWYLNLFMHRLDPISSTPGPMMSHLRLMLVLLAGHFIAGVSFAADITAYTEEWAPYNFSQNGKPVGIATELLQSACDRAHLTCSIVVLPWARAYALAARTPNSLLYTTARKPERESSFLWIGPIMPRKTWIFGREDSPDINSFAALGAHRIGVVNGDATIDDLLKKGVPPSALSVVASNEANLRQLELHRIDFVVDTEIGIAWSIKQFGIDVKPVRTLQLTDDGAYYFAANLHSDPKLIKRFQAALDEARTTKQVDTLVMRYVGIHTALR